MRHTYPGSNFAEAFASGCTTAREVAAHVGCSISTARRRMVRATVDPAEVRATLERVSRALRVAVLAMSWEEADDYTSACWARARNPLRRAS